MHRRGTRAKFINFTPNPVTFNLEPRGWLWTLTSLKPRQRTRRANAHTSHKRRINLHHAYECLPPLVPAARAISHRTPKPTPPAESVLLLTLRASCFRAFSRSSTLLFCRDLIATSSMKVKLLAYILNSILNLDGGASCSVTPSKRLSLHFLSIFFMRWVGRKPQSSDVQEIPNIATAGTGQRP